MKIDTDDLLVERVLNVPTEVYKIPVYQRSYSWGKDQWEELWQDIEKIDPEDTHFLGSIVVIAGSHSKTINEYEVVDGQQRLTTLLLLLLAIRDSTESKKDKEFIEQRYLFSEDRTDKYPKLILGRKDKDIFEKILKKQSNVKQIERESNIHRGYEHFLHKLSENVEDVMDFSDKVLKNLSLVQISAESHYDAFRLFETLNNRGLELSAIDLIKNYILGKVSSTTSKDELEQCIDIWDSIVSSLDNLDKVRFFRHYLISEKSVIASKNQLYKRYQEVVDKSCQDMDIVGLLEDIEIKSDIYKNIVNATFTNQEINLALESLSDIEASTSHSLLLKAFTTLLERKEKLNLIKIIEVFSLRRSICKISTRDLDDVYHHLCSFAFKEDDPIAYIKKYLKDRMPSNEDFHKNFSNSVRSNKEVQTKYILRCIEYYITNQTNEKLIKSNKDVHLEHIMPKEIKRPRSKKEFGDWESYLGDDAKFHKDYVNRFGNLTLLGGSMNISISNNPFENKKEQYINSNIQMTKDLCGYMEWRLKQIEDRSEKLAELACQVWSL